MKLEGLSSSGEDYRRREGSGDSKRSSKDVKMGAVDPGLKLVSKQQWTTSGLEKLVLKRVAPEFVTDLPVYIREEKRLKKYKGSGKKGGKGVLGGS